MKKLLFTLFLGLSATTGLACTPGAGNGPSGDPNCMGAILNNDPYYNNKGYGNSNPTQKIIQHVTVDVPSKYGALAMDQKTGTIGDSINENSLAEAKKAAIRQCGKSGCKVITWVRNGCIAAAGGKLKGKLMLYKAAEKPGEAESVAMSRCKKAGVSNCQMVVPEVCSVPDGMYN